VLYSGSYHVIALVTAAVAITTLVIQSRPAIAEAEPLSELELELEGEPAYWEAA